MLRKVWLYRTHVPEIHEDRAVGAVRASVALGMDVGVGVIAPGCGRSWGAYRMNRTDVFLH